MVGRSFYSIIIETYNAHDKLLIREDSNVIVELQFSHAHISKFGKIFGNSFAKSSELVHPKVLAKPEGRKKKMQQAVRQDQTACLDTKNLFMLSVKYEERKAGWGTLHLGQLAKLREAHAEIPPQHN